MPGHQPTNTDVAVAHAIVGLGVGAAVGQKAGLPGFIVGGFLGIVAHALFDAPLASVIAEIT